MFISALLERNRRFAATDSSTQAPAIPFIPNHLSFVITCIDPRTEPAGFLGIELGDAIVERVVGGRVTPAICKTSPTSATWSKPRPRLPLARIAVSEPSGSERRRSDARRRLAVSSGQRPRRLCWPTGGNRRRGSRRLRGLGRAGAAPRGLGLPC
jgi:hypothetical protein